MIEVVLLGTGNVATHLYRAFSGSEEINVKQVYNHSAKSLSAFESETATTTSLEELQDADVYLLALKDDVVSEVAQQLGDRKGLVAHTSGAVAMEALQGPQRTGVFYPLQTFSREKPLTYSEIPFCVEAGETKDLELLKKLAKAVKGIPYEVSSQQRKRLHLAAVFVCNFVNHLYTIGEDICRENKLPFEILQPLIAETAQKIQASSPREVQTGPAKRRDEGTIQAHLELLASEENKALYKHITNSIQSFHGEKL